MESGPWKHPTKPRASVWGRAYRIGIFTMNILAMVIVSIAIGEIAVKAIANLAYQNVHQEEQR